MPRPSRVVGEETPAAAGHDGTARAARLVLAAFVFTFMVARIVVFLITFRAIPDLHLHVGAAHIHHLNIGIILLSLVVLAAAFAYGLVVSFRYAGRHIAPILHSAERSAPP